MQKIKVSFNFCVWQDNTTFEIAKFSLINQASHLFHSVVTIYI